MSNARTFIGIAVVSLAAATVVSLASALGYAFGLRADVEARVAQAWTLALDDVHVAVCRRQPGGVVCDLLRDGRSITVACEDPGLFALAISCGQRPAPLHARGGP